MKYSNIFKSRIGCSSGDEVFSYLIATLKETVTKYDYFVNWDKAYRNLKDVEVDLNLMNYLVGKDDVEHAFGDLLREHPSVIRAIPAVMACRQNNFLILDSYDSEGFKYKEFVFKTTTALSNKDVAEIIKFAKAVGFLDILKKRKIRNLVDYVFGVEVGIDSNGRKNRGGKAMEDIVEFFLKDICERNSLTYLKEATSEKIGKIWGLNLTVDKSSRRIDFAILNKRKMFLVETNFYGGGGSKLKSTAGEYRTMYDFWKKDGHGFIWVTDGRGWKTTQRPLLETFNYTDYILNLDMVSKKILEDIIIQDL